MAIRRSRCEGEARGNPIEIPRYARNDTSCQIASAGFVSLTMTERAVILSRSPEHREGAAKNLVPLRMGSAKNPSPSSGSSLGNRAGTSPAPTNKCSGGVHLRLALRGTSPAKRGLCCDRIRGRCSTFFMATTISPLTNLCRELRLT